MKKTISTLLGIAACTLAIAQGFQNPVLPGFYPDPSVCRVGDTFYMVNSTFQYFPGVPIHRSKDLIHWEQIGHCLTRESQLPLPGATGWGGIYAPTIRYHEGTFYMVTTNCSGRGNFYVTATDPTGEWSEPIFVNQGGIDPDLFFDGNKVYFLSTTDDLITQCEIDIRTGERLTPSTSIWHGTGGRYAEAPHMYKKDGYYYLLIAEGGTEYAHRVTIARSRSVNGPFEANPANPILTHMNMNAQSNPIQGTGHADLVEAQDGSWWIVCLGFRPQSYTHHLLGRETFLAPVQWGENAWPVVNGDGQLYLDMKCATLPQVEVAKRPERDDFSASALGMEWNYLCNPDMNNYSLTARKGSLALTASAVSIDTPSSPTFVGRRQQHINFEASTKVDFSQLKAGSDCGLTVYMAHDYHYDVEVRCSGGKYTLVVEYNLGLIKHVEKEIALMGKDVTIGVEGSADEYSFFYEAANGKRIKLGSANTRLLSSETVGGFTGIYLGLYAQGSARKSVAYFDWFDYKEK